MARLSAAQWEQAKAEYEVRGTSLKRLAQQFRVDRAALSRKAKKEGWVQSKSQYLIEKRINAINEMALIDAKSHTLPKAFQNVIDAMVWEKLKAEGLLEIANTARINDGMSPLRKPRQ